MPSEVGRKKREEKPEVFSPHPLYLYDEAISFGTEVELRLSQSAHSPHSWWEGPDVPDVVRPERPAGRSGPGLDCHGLPDRTSGPVPAGRVRRPVVPYKLLFYSVIINIEPYI